MKQRHSLSEMLLRAGACVSVLVCPCLGNCDTDSAQWAKWMATALPAKLCEEGGPVMRCYAVTQAQCLEAALPIARQCVDAANLPPTLLKGEGGKYGRNIGSCTGDKLTDALPLKRGMTEQCLIQK
jgi:hypothetical protein